MGETAIEWSDKVWNPVRGCSKTSPGCENCYAIPQAHRFAGEGMPYEGLVKSGPLNWTGEIRMLPEKLEEPFRWRKPSKVFVNSMSDLFHKGVTDSFIAAMFFVMGANPRHTFQVLTKRSERMLTLLGEMKLDWADCINGFCKEFPRSVSFAGVMPEWPLPNVWLGVSVENQAAADERIPLLLQTPAAVRFLSVEPMLEAVDLSRWIRPWLVCRSCDEAYELDEAIPDPDGHPHGADRCARCGVEGCMISIWGDDNVEADARGERNEDGTAPGSEGPALDWVIVGGESGPNARPCDLAWIRSVVSQCRDAGVPCFVKQLGALPMAESVHREGSTAVVLRDKKGGDPSEWPEDLRVREFPRAVGR